MAYRLLVIDDEQDILRAISRVFYRDKDIELILANDAEEGLVKVRTIPIDVIICDQRMPGITGIELFHILKEEYRLIPLILLTGHATMELAIRAINEVGIFGFINKPWRKDHLVSMVRKAIDKRAQLKRDEDRKKYERLLEGRIWEMEELREQLTIFFAEWDEYLGPVLRSYYPNRLNLDFDELATHIFVSSVSVYGSKNTEYETSQVTMPIKYVDLEARLTYDAVDDETVRGGKRLQIIVVLLPEISVQTAFRIDEVVEKFQKKRNLADEAIIQSFHGELVEHIAAPKEIERRPIRFDFSRENALDDLVKMTFPKAQAGETVSSAQIEVMIIQASDEIKSGKTNESQAILVPLLLQTIEQDDRPLILRLLNLIAETLIENQKFHEAELYYRQIAELANKEPVIDIARSDALFGMGLIEIHEGEYDLSLGYLKRSMTIREELDDQEKLALNLNQIGICYGHLSKPERAVEFYQKSLEIQEKLEKPVGVADLLFNIGYAKMRSEKFEEARVFLESSLQIQEQKPDNIKKARTLNLLGLIELQLQNNFYALEQLIDAQECLSEREKDLNAIINFNMSQVYRVRNDFTKATEKLERSFQYWNSEECLDVNKERKISLYQITKAINLYLNNDEPNKTMLYQSILDGVKASSTEFSDMAVRNIDDFIRAIFYLDEGEITNARTSFDLSKNTLENLEWFNYLIFYHLLVIEQNIKEYETLSSTPQAVLENIKKDILISITYAERNDLSRSLILLKMVLVAVLVMTNEKEEAVSMLTVSLETISEREKSDFRASLKQWVSVLETNLLEEDDTISNADKIEKNEQLFYEIYQELRDINSTYEMNAPKRIDIIGKKYLR